MLAPARRFFQLRHGRATRGDSRDGLDDVQHVGKSASLQVGGSDLGAAKTAEVLRFAP